MSKGTLAGETRSSHYAITKALAQLQGEGLASITGSPTDGYLIALTPRGESYCQRHQPYIDDALQRASRLQFRYGRRPDWLELALARSLDSPSRS